MVLVIIYPLVLAIFSFIYMHSIRKRLAKAFSHFGVLANPGKQLILLIYIYYIGFSFTHMFKLLYIYMELYGGKPKSVRSG